MSLPSFEFFAIACLSITKIEGRGPPVGVPFWANAGPPTATTIAATAICEIEFRTFMVSTPCCPDALCDPGVPQVFYQSKRILQLLNTQPHCGSTRLLQSAQMH